MAFFESLTHSQLDFCVVLHEITPLMPMSVLKTVACKTDMDDQLLKVGIILALTFSDLLIHTTRILRDSGKRVQ